MQIDTFLARWRAAGGSERANYQLFIADLCELLEVDKPQPANEDTRDNPYVFERRVIFHHGDGSTSNGFIDCYKRGSFIGEAKKIRAGAETRQFDDALLRARGQAENYARQLHDELDTAVLEAYGWPDLAPTATDALLDRLVALNAERSREEATGHIRWLRPDFQNRTAAVDPEKPAKMGLSTNAATTATATAPVQPAAKRPWPATLPEQVAAIAQALAVSPMPLDEAAIAECFSGKGPWKKRLPQLLETLVALGRARMVDGSRYGASK